MKGSSRDGGSLQGCEGWIATVVSDTYCTLSDWGQCDYQEKENSCEVMNGLFKSFTGPCTRVPAHGSDTLTSAGVFEMVEIDLHVMILENLELDGTSRTSLFYMDFHLRPIRAYIWVRSCCNWRRAVRLSLASWSFSRWPTRIIWSEEVAKGEDVHAYVHVWVGCGVRTCACCTTYPKILVQKIQIKLHLTGIVKAIRMTFVWRWMGEIGIQYGLWVCNSGAAFGGDTVCNSLPPPKFNNVIK